MGHKMTVCKVLSNSEVIEGSRKSIYPFGLKSHKKCAFHQSQIHSVIIKTPVFMYNHLQ